MPTVPSTDAAEARRRQQCERAAVRRRAETSEQAEERRRRNRERARIRRARQTEAHRLITQEANRDAMRESRALEDTPTQFERNEANRVAMRQSRSQERTPDRQHRLHSVRNSQQVARRLFDEPEENSSLYLDLGPMDVPCRFCNALHFRDERIVSSSITNPLFETCCNKGARSFPLLPDPPPLLRQLFTDTGPRATHFRKEIRAYNTVLSMASVKANWVNRGRGNSRFNPTVTMQGQIYHFMGPLLPAPGRQPAFLSVYINDPDYNTQATARMAFLPRLRHRILIELAVLLHEVNPYVQTFRELREWALNDDHLSSFQMVIHADRRPRREHIRRYNGPHSSEVAALIPGNEDGEIGVRDIVVRKRGVLNANGSEVLDTIPVTHRSYDPLTYVILFPYGQDGWHMNLRFTPPNSTTQRKVTPLMYYSWQLFQRPTEFSTILHGKRLFQQYLVDQFCKVESERLSYLRQNQVKLRASDYTSLRDNLGDSLHAVDEADAVRAGRLFVLPSTFVGGDRYMRQQLHDIIAISNKLGHPDIFLTMTCNPNWPEIRGALFPGQQPQDRPDLCARVFRLKLKALMAFIIEENYFGPVAAHVRVIEFQKRGLPHAHIIFFLDSSSKHRLLSAENVDTVISAEIPPSTDPTLRELVLKNMIHTPCGSENQSAPCMGEGVCKKYFPKKFNAETGRLESEYYISYRRRSPEDGGESLQYRVRTGHQVSVVSLDNSWVVPYSPDLLRKLACHMNVELCVSRVGGIKYLFKYVCKGSDRVTMEIAGANGRYNEISTYQHARYVSASEAVWRLYSFDIVDRHPSVVRLDVHLEHHHTVFFREGGEGLAAARERPATKLCEWFVANQKFPGARYIRYDDFPKYFTWSKSQKCWLPRACLRRRSVPRGQASSSIAVPGGLYDFNREGAHVIGRIYAVSPREGERYFLRLLLTQVSGATSFENLRTVQGERCATFRDACLRMGLLADDAEWKRTISQSFESSFVPLTHLLATILLYCQPADPRSLWNEHLSMFLQDLRARHRGMGRELSNDEVAAGYALLEVQTALHEMSASASLEKYGLPLPPSHLPTLANSLQSEQQVHSDLEEIVRSSIPRFNSDQRNAFNKIVGAILPGASAESLQSVGNTSGVSFSTDQSTRVFFLDAPGGTGKTFLSRAIQAVLQLRGKNVITVATSAVAAVLLDGGRTAHSTFKIPIPALSDSTCNISLQSTVAERIQNVDLIIWDEIVMCHRFCLEAVERTLRDIMRSSTPFGGKFFLFSGDCRQILPVVPRGSRAQIVNACIKSSSLFSHFTTIHLTQNMRLTTLQNDPSATEQTLQFPAYLLQVGEGRVPETVSRDLIPLPPSIQYHPFYRTMCSAVFEGIADKYMDLSWITTTVILTTKNNRLPELNDFIGHMIPQPFRTYLSADKVADEDQNALQYPVEMLNTLTAGAALPDHHLKLKKGFMVMLLRNLDPSKGHVNGARYLVERMTSSLLFLLLATGAHKGQRLCLPRMPCGPGDDTFPVPGFTRTQFPVRVCFALTTNKAQGQSFGGRIGLDLRDSCFSHGQLYVALSRTTNPSNVRVCVGNSDRNTRNIVFPEVLT